VPVAELEKRAEQAEAEVLEWRNAASRLKAEVDQQKALAAEWSKKADSQRKRRKDAEAAKEQAETAKLQAEQEAVSARRTMQEVIEGVLPLVDQLAPVTGDASQVPFMARLPRAVEALRGYIRDSAHACVVQVLAVARALVPTLPMEPFASGVVPDVPEEELTRLEEEVSPHADAVVERLEF